MEAPTRILAITAKELKLLLRDPGGIAMLFILPVIFILVLSVALQGAFSTLDTEEKIDLLVVDEDEGDFGEKLIGDIRADGHFRIITELDGEPLTRDSIRRRLRDGEYQLAVLIPPDATDGLALDSDTTIEIMVDPTLSRQFSNAVYSAVQGFVHAGMIGRYMAETEARTEAIELLSDDLASAYMACPPSPVSRDEDDADAEDDDDEKEIDDDWWPAYQTEQPLTHWPEQTLLLRGLQVEEVFASEREDRPDAVQQNVPGWTIFALFWIAQILAINIMQERMSGAYKRIMVAPISLLEFVAGKMIPYLAINAVQAVCMFAIGVYVLPLLGCPQFEISNLPALAVVTLAISLVASSFGLFMAAVSRTAFLAASISASILIIMTVVGGIMVPKFVMPASMQGMAMLVPHGWALEAYLDILVRDYDLAHVMPSVGALLGFALLFFTAAMIKLKRLERQ